MNEDDFKRALTGKTITEARLNSGYWDLALILNDGDVVVMEAFGECCSESWIEHIIGTEALKGLVISAEVYLSSMGGPGEDSVCTERTDYAVKTANGTSSVCLRNDSNGYYSGWLSVDVIDEKEFKERFRERPGTLITEDF